jgi:hypothetical protein
VWIGWQWDIPRASGLGCSVPEVVDANGRPIEGQIRVQLQPFLSSASALPLRSASDLSGTTTCYPVAESGEAQARLLIASGPGRPFETVPRSEWRFATCGPDGVPVPGRESFWLEGGFAPDKFYEIHYRTDRCPLVGAGLVVFRDIARHLILGDNRLGYAFAVGWSQAGRFLRQYLLDGFNCDERGHQVFDAVLPFIAGSNTGQFNQRYGQPSDPIASDRVVEAPSAGFDLLRADKSRGTAPKVVSVNTASEYWRGEGCLDSIDCDGSDLRDNDSRTREYYLAGTEHLGGGAATPGGEWPPRNHLLITPLYRAVLELTRRWVVDGTPPPTSRRPQVHDGTAITRGQALRILGDLTGLTIPSQTELLSIHASSDPAPDSDDARVVWVSALDEDANDVAGIRHPELAVPLATHTGWNLIALEGSQWAAFASITGNSVPFPRSNNSTRLSKDRRLPIWTRYRNLRDFLHQLEASAAALAAEGFLLTEDIERVLATGRAHFESLVQLSQAPPLPVPTQNPVYAGTPRSNHPLTRRGETP